MTNAPTYATRTYTVAAGGSVQIARAADFLTCLEATAPFRVAFDHAPLTDFEAGLTYNTESGFALVEIINESAGDIVVTLGFGRGDIKDSRLTLSGQISVAPDAPETFATGPQVSALDGAATLLMAANSGRAEAIIANDGGGKIYLCGNPAAGAGEGLPLEPGGTHVLTTKAAIYGRNDSGAAVPVSVAEMERF